MNQTYRRADRPVDRRMVGGVAAGLAEHLGIPVLYVRIGFVVATWFNGAGLIAYALMWRFLPLATPELAPGLEAASRKGNRTLSSESSRTADVIQTVAMLAVGGGVLWLLQVWGVGVGWALLAPLLLALGGIALIWRQFDDAAWSRWMFHNSGFGSVARMALGALMVAIAGLYFLTQERGWTGIADIVSALGVAIVGIGLILGPWIYKLTTELSSERRERLRTQERADVAAHLHDSVLQTLALLQKNAADPAAVATLARRQERELRDWLYGDESDRGDTLVAELKVNAAEVEADHNIAVEVISVGDAILNSGLRAAAKAAREAMVNAAKHAATTRIDVYVEVGAESADVFIRDRGAGFDLASIGEDRRGVRGSIIERVERHGGTATIKSAPGEGTEVRIAVPIAAHDSSERESSS